MPGPLDVLITPRTVAIVNLLEPPVTVLNSATWTWATSSVATYNANNTNTSSATNDGGIWACDLTPGTWTLTLFAKQQAGGGIATIDISFDGGTNWTAVGTTDLYASASTAVRVQFTGIPVPRAGKALLRFRALSKNASSTGVQLSLSGASFLRTA